jgi:ABC-type sugar transport system permease subunit
VLFIYPAVRGVYVSFFDWSGFTAKMKFTGLENYQKLFIDPIFKRALVNNLTAVVFGGIAMMGLSLLFALILSRLGRSSNIFKAIIVSPFTFASMAVATFWGFILDPQIGLLNGLLNLLGLENLVQPWLGSTTFAFPAVLATQIWWEMGFYVLIILAGIARIPSDLYEAARVDGASDIQMSFRITIPLIWDVLTVVYVLWVIDAMRMFDIIWGLTKGGPANSSQVLGSYLYELGFGASGGGIGIYHLGQATAVGVVLFLIVFIMSIINLRVGRREIYEY